MTTKMIRLDPPEGREYYGSDPSSLGEYEIKYLEAAGIDVCVYYYVDGGYEGSGAALLRKDGKWAYHNLGHCSCYLPIESLPDVYEDLDTLLGRMSDDLLSEIEPLIPAARGLLP